MDVFLKKANLLKDKSFLLNFLSKFIIIRDKKNIEIDNFITNFESSINKNSYKKASEILNDSLYAAHFVKTQQNLSLYVELNDSINKIISFLTGGLKND
jgi:hypothetical protein